MILNKNVSFIAQYVNILYKWLLIEYCACEPLYDVSFMSMTTCGWGSLCVKCSILSVSPVCASSPCLNSGTCTEQSETSYICVCPFGFYGEHCGNGKIASFSVLQIISLKAVLCSITDGVYNIPAAMP